MKTRLALTGALLTCLAMTFSARAFVLFQDQFAYPANEPIAVASGGNGQTAGGGTWVSGAGSFYGTTQDIISTGNAMEIQGTGASDLPRAYLTNGISGLSFPAVPLFTNTVYYFASNAPVAALYVGFYLQIDPGAFQTNNLGAGSYFAYFSDTNFDFSPRLYISTNNAAPGAARVGITSASTTAPVDIYPGSPYYVVVRLALNTGVPTLWVSPTYETAPGTVGTAGSLVGTQITDAGGVITVANTSICGFGVRNFSSGGPLYISSMTIGTAFEDVVYGSGGNNPVFIATPPQNTTNFAGQPATLSVVAGGDQDTMTYQWSYNGTAIPGATLSSLSFSPLTTADTGTYSVLVANAATPAGVQTSAFLNVLSSDIAPSIVSSPTNVTATAGTAATFTVNATDGGAPLSYQWYFGSTAIASETNSSLTITSLAFANAGSYKVTVTNVNGDSITSGTATLVVNPPSPTLCTIQYLRSLLDNTNYNTNASFFANGGAKLWTVTGTNTTWENLTTTSSSEFYIQDGTAGIAIFWSGATPAAHMPPPGAVVTVTAPIGEFDGLLELSPVFTNTFHSVTWSNVGALPTPLPLPFDATINGNPNYMQKHLVGEYFGATNVFLDLTSGALFANGANEPLTNGQPANIVTTFNFFNATNATKGTNYTVKGTNVSGAVYTAIYYNGHTDIPNTPKPVGPVTVYGALGIFSGSTPPFTNGYELTPTRLADIVPAVSITNIVSNVIRQGDLATNSFNNTVLMPGETLTMTVVAHDPGGGTANITGLSGNGAWSAITGNGTTTATVTYTYTATTAAEGTADTPGLTASFSSSGWVGNYPSINTIYVPTAAEQNVRISELLSTPTSNTNSPAYDPLKRALPETGTISSQDQYIELVNINTNNTSQNINRWTLYSDTIQVYTFVLGETLAANTCGIVYGGPSGTDNDPPGLYSPTLQFHDNSGTGINLSSSGGTVSLYNLSGYLIDRVYYPPQGSVTGSFSRFFTMNGPMVPQAYINTNLVTPAYQYDEGSWGSPTTLPSGVRGTHFAYGNPLQFSFVATPGQVSTLWNASSVTNQFDVVTGTVFTNTSGSFTVTNPPPAPQFYFISTP